MVIMCPALVSDYGKEPTRYYTWFWNDNIYTSVCN